MTNHDKAVTRKLVKDFGGAVSLGEGALQIGAGLLGADDVSAVVAAVKAKLESRGAIVRGPGLRAS